jgi:hypothetical protein
MTILDRCHFAEKGAIGKSRVRLDVPVWHIASFPCEAEFDRYRGKADIDQAAPIKLDL